MAISIPPKGDTAKRLGAQFAPLQVSAQDAPNMTVKVQAGSFWTGDRVFIEYSGGNSPTITAPLTDAKLVVVGINENAVVSVIDGVASANPALPTVPAGVLPLAAVLVGSTTTAVTNDAVFDVRPLWYLFAESVPNLEDEIADRPTFADVTSLLATKADTTGTPDTEFKLNQDHTGVPTSDVDLVVERGTSSDVRIRWNEAADQWEFTNDGSTFFAIGASSGSFYTQAQLDGGQLDNRYYTEAESDAAFAALVHTHVAADITDFTAEVTALFSAITLDDLTDVDVAGPLASHVLAYSTGTSTFSNRLLQLNDLSDAAITAAASGEVLVHDGSNFANVTNTKSLISDFVEADYVHVTGVESAAGAKTFTDNMTVDADLSVTGTLDVTVDLDVTGDITGASLVLNSGEITLGSNTGAGSDAGIEIDRSSVPGPNALFYFDETSDAWLIGTVGDVGQVVTDDHTHVAADITDFATAVDAQIALADLDDLADVSAAGAVVGEVLKFDGADWVNQLPQPDYDLQAGTGGAGYTTAFTFSAPIDGNHASLQVFVNGLKQVAGAGKAYTTTPPTTVTFNGGSEPGVGDDVEFYGFG